MSLVLAAGENSALFTATESWRMGFQSVHFLLFLPVAVALFFLLPAKLRRPWLLLASYYFYFFAAPDYLIVLLLGTLFGYGFGRLISRGNSQGKRRALLLVGVAGLVLTLTFFKYNAFYASFLSPLFDSLGLAYPQKAFTTAKALGISFYTFTSIGYLIDVYAGTAPEEKNLLHYALFIGFFPAVLSGPISRADGLLPQLKAVEGLRFDTGRAAAGLRRMATGYFKKMAVADTLAIFVNAVYGPNLGDYSGITLIAATLGYTLQLYFDFSGYSDIALGAAEILGIKLPENFNTPFFATNFSGFWARWHMSLSSWLQDYIFTPLVWSRWPEKLPVIRKWMQKPPVLSSLAVVFLVSGIWHGDSLSFVVWGALQAVYRIGEELLHRFVGKPKKRPSLPARIGKTAVVLLLWMESLIFFRVGNLENSSVGNAASAFLRQFTGWSFPNLWNTLFDSVFDGVYNQGIIVYAFLLFTAVCLVLALWADWAQFAKLKGRPVAEGIGALPRGRRWLVYYGLVLCCFAAFLLQSGGYNGANFIYGGI